MNIIAISDFRSRLPDLIDRVNERLERLIITVSGKPKAVVISLDELESLEETAEVLTTPGILPALKKSKKEIKEGKSITLKELKKKYNL
jgi:antitoxin YefM